MHTSSTSTPEPAADPAVQPALPLVSPLDVPDGSKLGPVVSDSSVGDVPVLRVVPRPGDPLGVRLYRLLEECPPEDLVHVLDAAGSTDPVAADQVNDDEQVEFCRRSLAAAKAELGRIPSRRAYDAWRARQPDAEAYASSTTIRKYLGGGDWSKATTEVGALAPDVTARRLLSNGQWFSEFECRNGLMLFFSMTPQPQRTQTNYGHWARRYSRHPQASRIPLNGGLITERLGTPWAELRTSFADFDPVAELAPDGDAHGFRYPDAGAEVVAE